MTTEGLTIENEEGRDVLLLQPIDSERAEAISTPAARFLCALARIVADTQWDKLEPDETIWLLDTLRFNAHEVLAAEDLAREGDAQTVALQGVGPVPCHCGKPDVTQGVNFGPSCLFCLVLWLAAGEPEECPCDKVQDEFTNLPADHIS